MARTYRVTAVLLVAISAGCGQGSTDVSTATTDPEVVSVPDDLVAVLTNPELVGQWNLVDAEPPAGVEKPIDMHDQSVTFRWRSPGGKFFTVSQWGCGRSASSFIGLTTSNPTYGGGEGHEGDHCTWEEFKNGIWSKYVYPDLVSMRVDGDTMTATNDEDWLFTFERQPTE